MKTTYSRLSHIQAEEHLLRTLSECGVLSFKQYAEIANIRDKTAFDRMDRVRTKKSIHIDHWERGSSGPPMPFYAIGYFPDAKKPKPYSSKEKCERYRNTENGRKKNAIAAKRWKKSVVGQMSVKASSKTRSTKRKLERGDIRAIDPLLAVFYR